MPPKNNHTVSPQKGKLTLNVDKESVNKLNLKVLQRVDPSVKEILLTVTAVMFYNFNVDSEQWSRKNVGGSLFVVKRETEPQFQFIVMNQKSNDNLVENLVGDFEFEVQLPYLLYRNASKEVIGIWFYDARECENVAHLLNRLLFNPCSKVPTTKTIVSPANSKLKEAVLSPSVIDNPDIQNDPSIINSFNADENIGGTPNATISGQPYSSTTTIVSTSSPQGVARPTLPTIQIPSNLSDSRSIMSMRETSEPNTMHSIKLVTPSVFSPVRSPSPLIELPVLPSMLTARPVHSTALDIQKICSAPWLQSLQLPMPSPSLTPTSPHTPLYGPPVISRENVREALQFLVQDNHFIDMVYQAVTNRYQA